jgi:tripartite-type tricarboxylate transporter receptor subunit TctC
MGYERNAVTQLLIRLILLGILALTSSLVPAKAAFPERPLKITLPFGAGGNGDITARVLAEKLGKVLGQSVVVENLPGPGGMAAARATLSAPHDGHTITWLHSGTATGVTLVKAQAFDPLTEFVPIGGVSSFDHVIATSATSPLNSLKALLETARKEPGKLNVGTVFVGGSANLTSEFLKIKAGLDYQNVIFRSGPDLIVGAMRNDVQFIIDYYSSLKTTLQEGKLRALATTGLKRTPFLPEVPTVDEAGVPGFESKAWNALYVATDTPPDAVAQLSSALREVLAMPDVQKRLFALGIVADGLTPEAQDRRMRTDIEMWRRVAETAHLKPN